MNRQNNSSSNNPRKGAAIYDVRTEGDGGVKKYPKFADKQYIKFGQRGEVGSKNLKIVRTSYMEAPNNKAIWNPATMGASDRGNGAKADKRRR